MEGAPQSGRPMVLTEHKLTDISAAMIRSPRAGCPDRVVCRTVQHVPQRQKLQMFPYKLRVVQELVAGDFLKRVTYCWWFMEHMTPDGEELDDWY
ncbi:hypothetical protein PR048_031969 [Dryococelus australis]|uniref:Uncharacterized protein n=1 Tax=Dryococelus australis TaxID=614101 RepID=A0ABQ9G6S9_9NEOP|nr:hypothetical protein PR048_031969 [Dryococelus australis]